MLLLCAQLNSGHYRHGSYNYRIVNEKKRRDIAVAPVHDRMVHRLLYDYLVSVVDTRFDYDVWSCRRGKGLHGALKRTRTLTTKYSEAWIWRADVLKFFDNIDQRTLKDCLRRLPLSAKAQDLLDIVVGSYTSRLDRLYTLRKEKEQLEPQIYSAFVAREQLYDGKQTGIPIGNLTSQIFANIYLNEFDRFVRHTLKPLGFIRYGDDFCVFVSSAHQAERARQISTEWLEQKLKLQIHNKNNVIFKAKHGLKFLGHSIYPRTSVVIEESTFAKIKRNVNRRNLTSYKNMHLSKKQAKQLPWLLM